MTSRGRHFITDGFLCLPEPAVKSEAPHIEAQRGLDFHLSHSQQTGPEWINLIDTSTDSHCFISNDEKLDTHIITPAKKHSVYDPLTGPDRPPNLISAILYVEPLESISLKKYKSLVEFVL